MLEDILREHYAHVAKTTATPTAEERLRALASSLEHDDRATRRRTGPIADPRRLLSPVLAAAAVLAVVAGAAYGFGRSTAPTAPRPAGLSTAAATETTVTPASATALITPQFVVHTAIRLLPVEGQESHLGGSSSPGLVSGNLTYTVDGTRSYLLVEVTYPTAQTHVAHPTPCATPSVLPPTAERTRRNDGSTMVVVPNARNWIELYLCRADGVSISVTERAVGGGSILLQAADLASVVTSSSWKVHVPRRELAGAAGLFRSSDPPAGSTPTR